MSDDVLYVTAWNGRTRRPLGGGHRWLEPEEARALYGSRGEFQVIDGARHDESSRLAPRWAVGFGYSGVRAQFYNAVGSTWRIIDYDLIDGRLWRWITTDYVYPDDSHQYRLSDATHMYTSEFRPDATGTVEIDVKSEPEISRATLEHAPVGGFWLDRPEFGHWADLTNPEYGIPYDDAPEG